MAQFLFTRRGPISFASLCHSKEHALEHARSTADDPRRVLCGARQAKQPSQAASRRPQHRQFLLCHFLAGRGNIIQRFADGLLFKTISVLAIGAAWMEESLRKASRSPQNLKLRLTGQHSLYRLPGHNFSSFAESFMIQTARFAFCQLVIFLAAALPRSRGGLPLEEQLQPHDWSLGRGIPPFQQSARQTVSSPSWSWQRTGTLPSSNLSRHSVCGVAGCSQDFPYFQCLNSAFAELKVQPGARNSDSR